MIETVFILIILIGLLVNSMKKPKNFPPGPSAFPFIGNYYCFNVDENIQECWKLLHQKYGSLVGMIVPKFQVVLVNGWEHIREVLTNDDIVGRPDVCLLRDRFQGGRYGLIFKDGHDWKMQRRFVLHHFRNLGFGRKQHETVVMEEALSLADEIHELNGSPMAMEEMFAISAINITWCLLGGSRYKRSDPILRKLVFDIKESLHHVKIIGSPAICFPFLRYLFPNMTGYNGLTKGCKGILEFVQKSIKEHQTDGNDDDPSDLIDLYLQRMKETTNYEDDQSFSIPQLEGVCMDLLSAGSDTSSSVLTFSIMFLCLNPSLQEKIYQEIDSVLEGRTPKAEDRNSMVLTDAFLQEVLRFRSPTPTFPPHRAVKDTTVAGYSIPKDTILIPNYESILLDREYWTDPEVFRPQRFITQDGKLKKEERLISFGKGKRSCLGETLAKMTSFLLLVTLIERFEFRFANGFEPKSTEGVPGFTLAPPFFRVSGRPRERSIKSAQSITEAMDVA